MLRSTLVVLLLAAATLAPSVAATFPYPRAPAGVDPNDYASYLRLAPDAPLPNDYTGGNVWKLSSHASGYPEIDRDPHQLYGVTGMSVDLAWRTTTGRPDVVVAVLDSGILWNERELANKVHLNAGELPLPYGCAKYDCNGDGAFNVQDYANDPRVTDRNGNGFLDPEDLIKTFSDGVDQDGNGYVDDIAGWNALDNNNDPVDDVAYGHGTGEGKDSNAEADNALGFVGTCPSCMVMPIRVGQSFIATDADFGEGVVYAVDNGASLIQEALGTLDGSSFGRAAMEYAYAKGVPVMASAADEASYHHNLPGAFEHAIVVNSVRVFDQTDVAPRSYLYLNGCTNFGTNIAATVSSTSCSSEATGLSSGIAGLVISAARNAGYRLTPNEVRQLLTMTADDVDLSTERAVLSPVPTLQYPSHAGFDTYYGYGRLNADKAVRAAASGAIPPEAEILTPTWWQPVDPTQQPTLQVTGLTGARAGDGSYHWTLAVACGNDPLETDFRTLATGNGATRVVGTLATLDTTALDAGCGPLSRRPVVESPLEPNDHGLTLRLRVTDASGRVGEHRKYFYVWHDPDALPGFPKFLGAGGEQSPRMADLNGDGKPELVVSTSDGVVHAFTGSGAELPGFPVWTDLLPEPASAPAFARGAHEAIMHGGVAIADLDGDGRPELVAATHEGSVYVWESDGSRRAGFPVHSDPRYSDASLRDPHNRLLKGFLSAPVLADLEGTGQRDIIQAGQDRHLYVWRPDGSLAPGFPLVVVDRSMVDVDPVTGKVTPKHADGTPGAALQGSKIVSTPAIADLDGDGKPEMILGTNEEYAEPPSFSVASAPSLGALAASGLLPAGNGRLHAIKLDGGEAPGFPVKIWDLDTGLLPTVGDGVPGSAAIADINGDGKPEISIFSTAGPVYLLNADGSSYYGNGPDGLPRVMSPDAPGVPASDLPIVPGLGVGILADVTGTGQYAEYAPAAGLQRALDVVLSGEQVDAVDYTMAWDARTGAALPGWPRVQEDLQFITSPTSVDADGSGVAQVFEPSAGYYVHAFGAAGELSGWPKFTGHWIIASPAVGDIDGDGVNEVAITTREGWLFAWHAPGHAGGRAPWPTIHHDNANTGNAQTPTTAWGDLAPRAAPPRAPIAAPTLGIAAAGLLLVGRIALRRR